MAVHSFLVVLINKESDQNNKTSSTLKQNSVIIDWLVAGMKSLLARLYSFKVHLTLCLSSVGPNKLLVLRNKQTGCDAAGEIWDWTLEVFPPCLLSLCLCGPRSLFVKCWSQSVGSPVVRLRVWSLSVTHTRKALRRHHLFITRSFIFSICKNKKQNKRSKRVNE